MMTWNPLFCVGLCSCRNSWPIRVWFVASKIDLLNRSSYALAASFLLREVWNDPDSVEEIADASSAGKQEEVKEDASQR